MRYETAFIVLLPYLPLIGIAAGIVYFFLDLWESVHEPIRNYRKSFRISISFQRLMGHLAATAAVMGCGLLAIIFHNIGVHWLVVLGLVMYGLIITGRAIKRFAFAQYIIRVGGEKEMLRIIEEVESDV